MTDAGRPTPAATPTAEGRIMNAGQAASFLGVTKKRLYRMSKMGLPHRRLGRAMIFDRVALDEWLRHGSGENEPKRSFP